MPIKYALDKGRNIIIETWNGVVDAEALGAYWRTMLTDPEAMACRRTFVDLRDAELDFTGTQLHDLVQTVAIPMLAGRKWATALLVGAPAQYGKSRQYQVFAEMYSTDSIFTDPDAAETWLLKQRV